MSGDFYELVKDKQDNLYAIKNIKGQYSVKQIVKLNPHTGTHEVIANTQVGSDKLNDLIYLEKEKSILGVWQQRVQSSYYYKILKVNVETGKNTEINLNQGNGIYYYQLFQDDSANVYIIRDDKGTKQIVKIDPQTGKEDVITHIDRKYSKFFDVLYLKKEKSILGVSGIYKENGMSHYNQLLKISLETGKSTELIVSDNEKEGFFELMTN